MNSPQEKALAVMRRKGGEALTMLTAYDYPTGRLLDEAGVDMVLVGDSVGMTMLGFPDTTHVTLAHMEHHAAAVARGVKRALLVVDLPIHTYDSVDQALESARRLCAAGAEAVKLEGGKDKASIIQAIVCAGIPVVGHLGLLPQKVKEEGGYKIKGKTDEEIKRLMCDVRAVNEAGACCIVVEGTRPEVARQMTELSGVPTIGIGSGKRTCDGEVAVITDLMGTFPWFVPAFIQPKANVAEVMTKVASEWMNEVREARSSMEHGTWNMENF